MTNAREVSEPVSASTDQADVALRARVEQLERERFELARRANEAIADAQDRAYWLERWQLDLNALMRRPGMAELRAVARAVRLVARGVRSLQELLRR
jgi:hypothetical protein